jgi:hypothetical protein
MLGRRMSRAVRRCIERRMSLAMDVGYKDEQGRKTVLRRKDETGKGCWVKVGQEDSAENEG